MKNLILLVILLFTINSKMVGQINNTDTIVNKPTIEVHVKPSNEDEGTNNPETTGAIKTIVNGNVVYIKESYVNGLHIRTLTEPKN